jgi:hypothetical protein
VASNSFMSNLRIIPDKSLVFGLRESEVDSLDRYFFVIVPPILRNEILADLAKQAEDPTIKNKIQRHSYRISGNRGIPIDHRTLFEQSLLGNDAPMDGRFFPAGQTTVRSSDGFTGIKIETLLEDKTIARWERGEFTQEEMVWATKWREALEIPLDPKLYTYHIRRAGLEFRPPRDDKELVDLVDSLLAERKLQGRLFPLLGKAFRMPDTSVMIGIKRWFKEGAPRFKNFAPYAFFCIRANFLWALGMTNPGLLQPDKNDRKDLEYCYYLPYCEIFASNDRKHKRLVPFLLRPDQTFLNGSELKQDLKRQSEQWDALSREERIKYKSERGEAPPEDETSIVFQLWKKHRGKIPKPIPPEILDAPLIDSRLPEEGQVRTSLRELVHSWMDKVEHFSELSDEERGNLKETDFAVRRTIVSKERLRKMYPNYKG